MALLFDDTGTDQWLAITPGSMAITAVPFTISAWVFGDEVFQDGTIWWLGDKDVADNFFRGRLTGSAANPPARATASTAAGDSPTTSGNGTIVDVWSHVCWRFTATNNRQALVDGDLGNESSGGAVRVPAGSDTIAIGRANDSTPDDYFSGRIAEVAMWNAILTDDQAVALSTGFTPLLIKPGALQHYWPLGGIFGEHARDIITGDTMTTNGTPTFVDHPGNLIYPADAIETPIVPAVVAGIVVLRRRREAA